MARSGRAGAESVLERVFDFRASVPLRPTRRASGLSLSNCFQPRVISVRRAMGGSLTWPPWAPSRCACGRHVSSTANASRISAMSPS